MGKVDSEEGRSSELLALLRDPDERWSAILAALVATTPVGLALIYVLEGGDWESARNQVLTAVVLAMVVYPAVFIATLYVWARTNARRRRRGRLPLAAERRRPEADGLLVRLGRTRVLLLAAAASPFLWASNSFLVHPLLKRLHLGPDESLDPMASLALHLVLGPLVALWFWNRADRRRRTRSTDGAVKSS